MSEHLDVHFLVYFRPGDSSFWQFYVCRLPAPTSSHSWNFSCSFHFSTRTANKNVGLSTIFWFCKGWFSKVTRRLGLTRTSRVIRRSCWSFVVGTPLNSVRNAVFRFIWMRIAQIITLLSKYRWNKERRRTKEWINRTKVGRKETALPRQYLYRPLSDNLN